MKFSPTNIKMWSRLGSCGAFGLAAMDFPELEQDTVICTADLCYYSGLERFRARFPERLYNVGIAEQNLVGIAGGLAKEGINVFATTYASFATTRALDQVRVNMGYMKLPIKLVGLTSGLSVGILGATHMSIEDIAIMRSIPNITILSPADCTETVKATLAAAKFDGPIYIRLTGSMNNSIVYKEDYSYEIGKAITLKQGTDVAIVATGTMVYNSQKAMEIMEAQGISCTLIDMHTIKPLDVQAINGVLNHQLIVTVEEHSVIGGLGSAVAEYIGQLEYAPQQMMIGISDSFAHAADYNSLICHYKLTPEDIAKKITNKLKRRIKND